jgi:hypothetical protein
VEDSDLPDTGLPDTDLPDAPVAGEPVDTGAAHPTGDAVVDAVLRTLDELPTVPVSEHVAIYEAAHDRLRDALTDGADPTGAGAGPSAGAPPVPRHRP